MRRTVTLIAVALSMLAMMAAPAAAHILVVDSPGGAGEPKVVSEIGGGALPDEAQGEGLIPGGPGGLYLQTPAHDGGLVTACKSLRAHGNGVVDIFGPAAPGVENTCRHGGR